MKPEGTGSEFSGMYHDTPGETAATINEHYQQRLHDFIARAKTYPMASTESGSDANAITERLEICTVDEQKLTIHFFIYTPEEHPSHHLPYSPSINAVYILEAVDDEHETIDKMFYLSSSSLDSSNSRFDETQLLATFEGLERACDTYEELLKARGDA